MPQRLLLVALGTWLLACAPEVSCPRAVRIVRPPVAPESYRVVGQATATCVPLDPKRCDRILRARACELDADVLLLSTHTVVGRRGPAQITQRASLVRFGAR
ncbi:MAG: hypothetical protein QM756_17445 [Polyangiaceae bacterium]